MYPAFPFASLQVYQTLKAFAPQLSVYPSFSHESVMGIQDGQPCKGQGGGSALPPATLTDCIKQGLATISDVQRDVFATSVYPTASSLGNGAWQLWYMTSVWDLLDAKDAATIAITQYGYDSVGITVNFANGTTPLMDAAATAQSFPGAASAPDAAATLAGDLTSPSSTAVSGLRGAAAAPASPTPACTAVTTASNTDATGKYGVYTVNTALGNSLPVVRQPPYTQPPSLSQASSFSPRCLQTSSHTLPTWPRATTSPTCPSTRPRT